jgi:glycosyltransferase involved in cell wall biosynthesis
MAESAELVDEIWTYSAFSARAIRRTVDKPVYRFPLPVVPGPVGQKSRAELHLPEGFVFLFSFDFHSVAERKNPSGVVEAFCRAFQPNEGPQLVVKSINGMADVVELERLRSLALDRDDIHIIDGYFDRADQRALMASCDAYVSLHRAEGFGYTLAEAMLAEKPVIATGYSGNLEFMNEDNSFLVGYRLIPVREACEPYPTTATWADPDLDEAAALMRTVVADPARAKRVGGQARRDIAEHHSPAARAPLLAARLAAARVAAADHAVPRRPASAARRLVGAMASRARRLPGQRRSE